MAESRQVKAHKLPPERDYRRKRCVQFLRDQVQQALWHSLYKSFTNTFRCRRIRPRFFTGGIPVQMAAWIHG